MNKNDFINIMENGFQMVYQGTESELRCFECGAITELKKINRRWRVVCINNHKYTLTKFMVAHVNMRDHLADTFIENTKCNFQ